MTRMHQAVYFDVCCYIWDKNDVCPAAELPLMLGDVADWQTLVGDLIRTGKLTADDNGALSNKRALYEAERAFQLWHVKSEGGKVGAAYTNNTAADASPAASAAASVNDTPPPATPDAAIVKPAKIRKKAAAATGTPLAANFTVSDDWLQWAMAQKRWSRADATVEAVMFVDYYEHKVGPGGIKDDWYSTWRQWCQRAHRKPSLLNGTDNSASGAYIRLKDAKPAM